MTFWCLAYLFVFWKRTSASPIYGKKRIQETHINDNQEERRERITDQQERRERTMDQEERRERITDQEERRKRTTDQEERRERTTD